ncbi:MAG: phosphoribosylformylglycinamidine synthase subunit PurL [Roseofilum sp. SID3]|uniref:phosphoribosylformylglycinamidine synthase subunit PurL n=1 Tax=unclassified Roseofilum TaxID=2620099 RepID=UPI001B1E1443|nr:MULTISPECIES: phosphoribosylformylglycinamidine synthase subunit PurL [unclassified Roseofilum]MBP0014889.1 phosphoribosylformylglycinamidine synthase subunit PurL [Roseofilum sp. SID3]MBP0036698.1 phosphoribosylformylglycinamidine synthase subunit PurL [Roseofilum sp. SID1]
MAAPSDCPFSPQDIASEGLKPSEYEEIVQRLGRHPNKAELGMFGVMWSEHCCYKNSRPLLSQFPTTGDRILVGPGENAGVVDLGDGLRLAFKIESHNHPSAIEPFQGAATGVGGILRDIFTMGARPIAVLNSLRFGSLEDSRTRRIFTGVVDGIAHYGNSVGVPTVGGEVYFDPAYTGNPLVNVMALGLMETAEIVKSGASGRGNPVLYVGSTTGRDGMGGASFASAELSESSMDDRPAVQVGDPFLEKSLIEACLEAFNTGAVVAAQDMGAAGITCSTSEMAAKGGVGIELDLDKIPVRETGMVPYEYLLSESQERMLFVAYKGREQELIDIFHRWGLQAAIAGEVIDEPIVRILFQGQTAAEITATALSDNTPIYHRELMAEPPEYAQTAWQWTEAQLPECKAEGIEIGGKFKSWKDCLLDLLDTPTIASKQWVYRQYDHQVQNNTVVFPGGADASIIRLRPVNDGVEPQPLPSVQSGVAATVDCNSRYVYLNPYEGAKAVVAEAARNLSCVGAEPIAVTDNLNFGSPEKPIGYWQLAEACRGLSEACGEFSTPVTGGNVSLYNETLDSAGNPQPIYPTPVVGMVGLVPNLSRICGQGWCKVGDRIYLLGSGANLTLGASEYLASLHNTVAGQPPKVDFDLERRVQAACRHGIRQGWLNSAHDCAEGGLAVALAESCIAGGLGAQIECPSGEQRPDLSWFGEGLARIVVSVAPEFVEAWEAYLEEELPNQWQAMGTVQGGAALEIKGILAATVSEMGDRHQQAIPRRLHV